MTIKYRAELHGVKLERPQQCFGPALPPLEDWAKDILKRYPGSGATVAVYEQIEQKIKVYKPEV